MRQCCWGVCVVTLALVVAGLLVAMLSVFALVWLQALVVMLTSLMIMVNVTDVVWCSWGLCEWWCVDLSRGAVGAVVCGVGGVPVACANTTAATQRGNGRTVVVSAI